VFTGFIEEIGRVASVSSNKLVVAANKVLKGMEPGDSISVNGSCLTVTNLNSNSFYVDIMTETLKRTNLGLLHTEDSVNLERALTLGKLLGGHLVQGHVDATGRVISVRREEGTTMMRFEAPSEVTRYVVKKGFISVDGASLTVVAQDASSFEVAVVGYTQKNTTLGRRQVGELVNIEVDIIAKYVERFSQTDTAGVTFDFLQEHGFIAY
jgi:riboflavin synthase|tara:strand:- start:2079 stop:2708 length:630 start_codon:yes stop_codon:yes gene_type:complete